MLVTMTQSIDGVVVAHEYSDLFVSTSGGSCIDLLLMSEPSHSF